MRRHNGLIATLKLVTPEPDTKRRRKPKEKRHPSPYSLGVLKRIAERDKQIERNTAGDVKKGDLLIKEILTEMKIWNGCRTDRRLAKDLDLPLNAVKHVANYLVRRRKLTITLHKRSKAIWILRIK
jgi:hypothetical protein